MVGGKLSVNKSEWKAAQSKARQETKQQETQAEAAIMKIIRDAITGDDSVDPFRPPWCEACKCYHAPEAGHFEKDA